MIREFEEYLSVIDKKENKDKFASVLKWVINNYPKLEQRIAWNTPVFQVNDTFIVAFAASKAHFSVNVEIYTKNKFEDEIKAAGYETTAGLFKIKYKDEINFKLLEKLIDFQIKDKAECKTFWRK